MLAGLDFGEGKLDEARRTLTALLSTDPRNADAQMLLGQVEEASSKYGDAIEHYTKAVEANDTHIYALNNLAFALSRNSQQLDEALKYAQKARELAPESSQAQDTLGWVYYRKGLYQRAETELTGALAKDPRPAIQYHLGLTYQGLGKTKEGSRLIAAALAVQPMLADEANTP